MSFLCSHFKNVIGQDDILANNANIKQLYLMCRAMYM